MQIYFFDRQKRPGETRALCQRFKSPFRCQFIRLSLKKKQPAWMKQGSLTNIFHKIWHKEGEKAFLAAKSFYLISSPPWLEPSWVWLEWDRYLLGSAAAERLLSDFVFVPMHSAAKILTSTTRHGTKALQHPDIHTNTQMELSINSAYRLSSRAHESSRVGADSSGEHIWSSVEFSFVFRTLDVNIRSHYTIMGGLPASLNHRVPWL